MDRQTGNVILVIVGILLTSVLVGLINHGNDITTSNNMDPAAAVNNADVAASADDNDNSATEDKTGTEAEVASTASTSTEEDEASVRNQQEVDERFVGRVAAPPFPASTDWLNVDNPITLDGLQGKIVLLDFWTYGCINCIHMIPILAELEEKYADELVVIGVHSAKFENEGETENIRQIVQRYDLHHPVINDSDFAVWRTYDVRAWPTFTLIDPRGNVVAVQSGEVPFEAFDAYLSNMIEYYDNLGTDELNREPLAVALEGAGDPGTPLLFPGKVLADAAGGRLFIADSNHHRIVIADLQTYEVLDTIGTGQRGFADGSYDEAQFHQPQGMALADNTLYVADVNNHALRAVDLEGRDVRTIAGTGEMGRGIPPFSIVIEDPLAFDLRSPWDVELSDDGLLYIAMAGTHQIWQLDLERNLLQAAVGNGREAQLSTTLSGSELAQPSGLYFHAGQLYFADSESSTVRVAHIPEDEVRVIAGTTENNLFEFGDADGAPGASRLQHALGVVGNADGTQIFIADTYNSKIKMYDPRSDEVTTLYGLSGNGGFRDGDATVAQFDEPGGLDYAGGKLYVADTNNHAIRVIDLDSGMVETVQFPNPQALTIESNAVTVLGGNAADDEQIQLQTQTVSAGDGELVLNITLPEGFKINEITDSTIALSSDGDAVQFESERVIIEEKSVQVPVTFSEGEAALSLDMTLFYCEAQEEAFCLINQVTIHAPVTVASAGSNRSIMIERTVILPEGVALTGDL